MSVKFEILKILEENKGKTFSGETLAAKLHVSRNAVWKAVNSLKKDGYGITSVNNRGYTLVSTGKALSEKEIKAFLNNFDCDIKVCVFDEIDSTNAEAKRIAAAGFNGDVLIVADSQTAGRGRLGRSFFSPAKTGIYMSFLYHPKSDITANIAVTSAAAVAVVRAIEKLTGLKPMIKWVNDIYIGNRKVCGILTEAITDFEIGAVQSVIVGIGINITTTEFPAELAQKAGSLEADELNRNRLAAEITGNLMALIATLPDKLFLYDYKSHSMVIGREVVYTAAGESHKAVAVDIDDNGGLIVRSADGSESTLSTGEISLKTL